jgi:hypothetical protein
LPPSIPPLLELPSPPQTLVHRLNFPRDCHGSSGSLTRCTVRIWSKRCHPAGLGMTGRLATRRAAVGPANTPQHLLPISATRSIDSGKNLTHPGGTARCNADGPRPKSLYPAVKAPSNDAGTLKPQYPLYAGAAHRESPCCTPCPWAMCAARPLHTGRLLHPRQAAARRK